MHSFHPSRGRVLFEFACALGIVASCVGAWKQTGASALLVSAFVAGLYGFVRLFDLPGRRPAADMQPQRIEFAADDQVDLEADEVVEELPPVNEPLPQMCNVVEEPAVEEPAPSRAGKGRRAGGSRKGSGRRTSAAKEVKIVDLAPPEEEEAVAPLPPEEAVHTPVTPLFQPEPFARQHRTMFGRKAG